MKTFNILSIFIIAIFFVQPMFAQSSSRKVVATRIKTDTLSHEEQDFLRDINTYLHSAFENNGYALVSLDEEDREDANKLELLNYIDANVRGMNGEAVDYVIILWLEHINGEYKIYSKKIGRSNTEYKLGTPIVKSEKFIGDLKIRRLTALEVAEQYVIFSDSYQLAIDRSRKDESELIKSINKISLHSNSYFNMRVLSGFTNKDVIGLGFHGNKSYFQIGADIVFSKIFSYKSQIEEYYDWGPFEKHETTPEWNVYDIEKNMAIIKANYYQLKQTEDQITKGEQDYIRPQFQFAISPGINLKYVSIECGLGMVVSQSVKVKRMYYNYRDDWCEGVDEWPKSQTNLLIRPTLVGYIPMGRNGNGGISISVGYNIVNKLDIYNGFIVGLGFIVKL